jgi:hypothetical protein
MSRSLFFGFAFALIEDRAVIWKIKWIHCWIEVHYKAVALTSGGRARKHGFEEN